MADPLWNAVVDRSVGGRPPARPAGLVRLLWPLSADSAAAWVTIGVIMFTVWARAFLFKSTPAVVKKEQEKKRAQTEKMREAVLDYVRVEEKKQNVKDRKMPEAQRVLRLLWDETYDCRTESLGRLAGEKEVEDLLRKVHSQELRKCIDKTRQAREHREEQLKRGTTTMNQGVEKSPSTKEAEEVAAALSELGEHESGEKLVEAIEFAKGLKKRLGPSFVDPTLVLEAKSLYKVVYKEQSANTNALWTLVRPVVPTIIYTCLAQILNSSLRGAFHSIGPWTEVVEAGQTRNFSLAYTLLFKLWVGHMVIEFVERVSSSYGFRAESVFQQRIRNGVLAALVRQDYEYFDKTAPGVLQDRLNRDASDLGQNLIRFPQHMFGRLSWIIVNVIMVYMQCPFDLFIIATLPLMLMIPLQYFAFKCTSENDSRERKVSDEITASTSEVLREIKMVRQFAMEPRESANHARGEVMRQIMTESLMLSNQMINWFFWSLFVSGLCATMYLGIPYVVSGQMKVHELVDVVFKINCHLSFPVREILDDLHKANKLLQPLGRICDLLQSRPVIEPSHDPAFVDATSPAQLNAIFSKCESFVPSGVQRRCESRTLLKDALDVASKSVSSPMKGSQLVSLRSSDHEFLVVKDTSDIDTARLKYPVRAVFSQGLRPARFRGRIQFDDVHFSYPTEMRKKVLDGLSFTVEPGQKVALVGTTGCGKSSCMSLLQRLYEPQSGRILIDDVPLQEYDIQFLRSRIVIVDQNTVLLNTTIRNNIAYGIEVSDEEVIQACKDAKAWDFINEKPDKLMTMVLDGGKNLSGGQRQRLAIARAMVRKPDVILLDEATSALDNENEALVQESLDRLAREGSALVIAHRLSTIKDSDVIVFIDKGRVVESGTHDQLIKAGGESIVDENPPSYALDICNTSDAAPLLDENFPPPQLLYCRASTHDVKPSENQAPDMPPGLVLSRHKTDESPMRKPTSVKPCYKRVWDAAVGSEDKLSLGQMQKKHDQMESELHSLKARMERMRAEKSMLLHGFRGSGAVRTSPATGQAEEKPKHVSFGSVSTADQTMSDTSGW